MGFHQNPFREIDPVDMTAGTVHATVTEFAGCSLKESASSPAVATVEISREEGDADGSGQLIATIELAANESVLLALPGRVKCPEGVYVKAVAGTTSGVLYRWV